MTRVSSGDYGAITYAEESSRYAGPTLLAIVGRLKAGLISMVSRKRGLAGGKR
jgi:hypothetical protein